MTTLNAVRSEIKDASLASQGKNQIAWADNDMPVLASIRERFEREQPLKGLRVSHCAHLTKETAVLAITVKAAGADLVVIASNPLTTQDDVAASLVVDYGIPTYAIAGETVEQYNQHVKIALDHKPHLVLDDGGDMVATLLQDYPELIPDVIGSTEETTAGIKRLKAMDADNSRPWPAVGVNESQTKHLFDNRYGTGQSTMDSIMRACNILLAGKVVVVAGYGWCGKGCAMRARGLGANVIVTEVDPMKALEASMEGFRVMPIAQAAPLGDVFVTVTSNKHAIDVDHIQTMKPGAVLSNAGHFDYEFNYAGLKALATSVHEPRPYVEVFTLPNGNTVTALAEGRLVNLTAAEGHPASVMDMSFANQALGTEYLVKNRGKLPNQLLTLPEAVDSEIARLKLETLGIDYDTMTPEQVAYMASWKEGT